MPLRTCDYWDCSSPVERDFGNCMLCRAHRCLEHFAGAFHSCPSKDEHPDAYFAAYDAAKVDHLQALLAKIDFSAISAIASSLYDNIPCTLPAFRFASAESPSSIDLQLVMSQMGGQNCHLDVCFEDGVVWIARLRLDDPTLPPHDTQRRIFTSEVDTLRFLNRTNVPVPKVFYANFDDHEVGSPIVLMQKLPGSPLQWNDATAQQKTKVMEQLADVFIELHKHPFSSAGSLASEGKGVGPYAQVAMFSSPSHSLGPFNTFESALKSIEEHQITMIENGELRTLALDNYLSHLWRLEHVPFVVEDVPDPSFYIKHFDDKGDHILVDEDYNLTGIIDWEFASTESKSLAFSSPCMMWPVGDFYDGSNELSAEEIIFAEIFTRRDRDDLAQCVRQGRKHQRFLFFLGGGVADRAEFEGLFRGLRSAFDGQCKGSYEEWKRETITARGSSDQVLQRLLRTCPSRR